MYVHGYEIGKGGMSIRLPLAKFFDQLLVKKSAISVENSITNIFSALLSQNRQYFLRIFAKIFQKS
jgi:hypothetical protein